MIVVSPDALAMLIEAAVPRAIDAREPTIEPGEWLDAKAAGAMLGVCARTVQNIAADGALPASRVGRLWRFRRSDLEAYLARERKAG